MLILCLVAYTLYRQRDRWQADPPVEKPPVAVQPETKPAQPEVKPAREIEQPQVSKPQSNPLPANAPEAASYRTLVHDMVIRDEEGEVIYRGTVDLADTLDRIAREEPLSQFRNDGVTFENRERRLPKQQQGYYREWVHPTPKQRGPGPQRVVSGEAGERWYTPNHYRSFIDLRKK